MTYFRRLRDGTEITLRDIISINETHKDFSKSEHIDYARKLERVESIKAKERQGQRNDIPKNSSECCENGEVSQIVAQKIGIGSKNTYRKEKFIVDNKSSLSIEDFAEWDEGKLSTNKEYRPYAKYAKWFERMCEYGFTQNIDYTSFSENSKKPLGGRPSTDHQLTIEMAKELCMIQRGDVGGSAKKVGLRIKEIERLYGVRQGSAGGTGVNQYSKKLDSIKSSEATQSDIAKNMGIGNKETYLQYKKLADMIPELSELVDTGVSDPLCETRGGY